MKKIIPAILTMIACLLPITAFADYIGIARSEFNSHYRKQEGLMLCWAASAEMVLSYEGISLPQQAIVSRARGILTDAPGNPFEMFRSTNGVFNTQNHGRAVISGQFVQGPPAPTVLYNQLKNRRPIILLYQSGPWSGHAVVLIGIDATVTASTFGSEIQISRLHIFDPFSYRQVPTPYGPQFQHDPSMIFHIYNFQSPPNLFPGQITGAYLVDGTTL